MRVGNRTRVAAVLLAAWMMTAAAPGPSLAQDAPAPGVRAAGMAGAFVAVADDATAAYWNPAGLATGDFFGAIFEHQRLRTGDPAVGQGRTTGLFLGTPPLGVAVYRLRSAERGGPGGLTLSSLVTTHLAVTLLQSLGEHVNIGGSLKAVRGGAGSRPADLPIPADVFDLADDLDRGSATRFDADIGVMLRFERVRAGLAVRNLTEPAFPAPDGTERGLERHVRAGVAVFPRAGLVVAADADLTRGASPSGARRGLSLGAEQQVGPRAQVRGGVRLQTVGDRRPAAAAGASAALTSLIWIDAQVTGGAEGADRGWGVGLRVRF